MKFKPPFPPDEICKCYDVVYGKTYLDRWGNKYKHLLFHDDDGKINPVKIAEHTSRILGKFNDNESLADLFDENPKFNHYIGFSSWNRSLEYFLERAREGKRVELPEELAHLLRDCCIFRDGENKIIDFRELILRGQIRIVDIVRIEWFIQRSNAGTIEACLHHVGFNAHGRRGVLMNAVAGGGVSLKPFEEALLVPGMAYGVFDLVFDVVYHLERYIIRVDSDKSELLGKDHPFFVSTSRVKDAKRFFDGWDDQVHQTRGDRRETRRVLYNLRKELHERQCLADDDDTENETCRSKDFEEFKNIALGLKNDEMINTVVPDPETLDDIFALISANADESTAELNKEDESNKEAASSASSVAGLQRTGAPAALSVDEVEQLHLAMGFIQRMRE